MQAFPNTQPFVSGQEGLTMLADAMLRPSHSPSPFGPSSSQSPYPGYQQQPSGAWMGGNPSYQDIQLQQQLLRQSQPLQSSSPFSSQWPAQTPYVESHNISPEELQLNLQSQMLYLQWQQAQIQAGLASSGMPQAFPPPITTQPTGSSFQSGSISPNSPTGDTSDGPGGDDKRKRNTEASGKAPVRTPSSLQFELTTCRNDSPIPPEEERAGQQSRSRDL